MKTHPHWAMLVQFHWILIWLLCIGALWALGNPHAVITTLHLTTATPGIGAIQALYGPWRGFASMMLLLCMFLAVAGPWTWWAITYYEIDGDYLIWSIGPFQQNQIPISKIQDIQVLRGALALILGYGTLMIDSGRAQVFLKFLPQPNEFLNRLEWSHPRG